jgi:GH25 family lysozyme M1 (1,4-beta-N-acetylmuramidase)
MAAKKQHVWTEISMRRLLAAAGAAVCMSLLSGCGTGPFFMVHRVPRATGIDVSVYQRKIDWNAVADDAVQFAWTKATEGSAKYVNYSDAYLAANIAGANKNGILIGVYHFAHPRADSGPAGAQEEALLFITAGSWYMTAGYLRPVLDIEVEGSAATSAWVNDFLNDVYDATGVTPIIYTYTNFALHYLNSTVANRNLWMADAPAGANPQHGVPLITPFQHWNFWQYGQADINGISSGVVDQDVANGNLGYVRSFLIPAQTQLPGTTENATADAWTGLGTNGSWSNAANWNSAWAPGDVAEFTDSSLGTTNITFDQMAGGHKVVNVAQIDVADGNAPAVSIHGSDPIDFQTYLDPIYNNGGHTLTINAPMVFFGTMGTAGNASTNSIYTGPGNIVLGGNILFDDSQTQVSRFGFNDVIAIWNSHANTVPGNVIISGTISDAADTPTGDTNGFYFSNAGGYDDVISNNANWHGGMYVAGGATLLVSAGGSTGTGAVTLDGMGSGDNGLQPAGIHGGLAGEGTIRGLVTVVASDGAFTGGGKLINHLSTFSPTLGKLTLAAGLNLNSRTASFHFYLAGLSNSSISIGGTLALSKGDTVALRGTPLAGTYHLFDYHTVSHLPDLKSWTVSGPHRFEYVLINNPSHDSIDLRVTARLRR